MKIIFQSLSQQRLLWRNESPEKFTGIRLGGSFLSFASGPFGNVFIQEIRERGYKLYYYSANSNEHSEWQTKREGKGLFIRIALQNSIYHLPINGNTHYLREGQFMIEENGAKKITSRLEAFTSYSWMDIIFSSAMITSVRQLFTQPGNLFMHAPRRAAKEIRDIIQSILRCNYADRLRHYFFDLKMRELLLQVMIQLSEAKPNKYIPSVSEVDAAYAAEKIITSDLATHQFIPELSRKVNMNESYFKAVFKQVFGAGPFEYRQQKRMEKAMQLLEAGFSVKESAIQTGYRVTYFVMAFREYFGYTPGSIKRGRR